MKRLLTCVALLFPLFASAQQATTWRFDSTKQIAGHPTTVLGAPKVVQTDIGKAVEFAGNNTAGDALFVDSLPLAGALNYTFEVVFRPSSAGQTEQRFFHMQENGSESRRMFELRIVDHKWCLDTVAFNYPAGEPVRTGVMLNCDAQHTFPLDRWYAVAAVYDGKVLRAYVDGVLQGEIAVSLIPLGPGGTSVGTRYTKRDYFTGDIFSARFTPSALPLDQLLKAPSKP